VIREDGDDATVRGSATVIVPFRDATAMRVAEAARRGRKDLGVTDAVDVDPHVLAACLERVDEPRDEGSIPPRTGQEYVSHTSGP
jgi:hypothetical protein